LRSHRRTGCVVDIDLIPSWSGAFLALLVISAGFSHFYYGRAMGSSSSREDLDSAS
jgi:hypothetical protein